MVSTPSMFYLIVVWIEHFFVDVTVKTFQHLIQIFFDFWCHHLCFLGKVSYPIMKCFLRCYVLILEALVVDDCTFKNLVLFSQSEPLEFGQKLVEKFVHFVSVCHTTHVNFYVVFTDQRLCWHVCPLHVEWAATISLLCRWSKLRLRRFIIVFLVKPLIPWYCLI